MAREAAREQSAAGPAAGEGACDRREGALGPPSARQPRINMSRMHKAGFGSAPSCVHAQLLQRLVPQLEERREREEKDRMAADRTAAIRAAAYEAQAGLGRCALTCARACIAMVGGAAHTGAYALCMAAVGGRA